MALLSLAAWKVDGPFFLGVVKAFSGPVSFCSFVTLYLGMDFFLILCFESWGSSVCSVVSSIDSEQFQLLYLQILCLAQTLLSLQRF